MTFNQERKEEALARQQSTLDKLVREKEFFVFLCGPSSKKQSDDSELRKWLHCTLKNHGFTVVLGEDDGLEEPRLKRGADAQTNEVQFLRMSKNVAVIIIASSVGSFCELGLFSGLYAENRDKGGFDQNVDPFFVIFNEEFKDDKSYIREGPIKIVDEEANVYFSTFTDFEEKYFPDLLQKLRGKRVRSLDV